jgi:hypothetical protein
VRAAADVWMAHFVHMCAHVQVRDEEMEELDDLKVCAWAAAVVQARVHARDHGHGAARSPMRATLP